MCVCSGDGNKFMYVCMYVCKYVCENGLITVNTKINFMVMQYDMQLSYAYPGRR